MILKKGVPFVENDWITIWMEDEIMYGVYKKGCIISKDNIDQIIDLRLQFQQGKAYKGMVFVTNIKAITPDAREAMARRGYDATLKVAVITNSMITNILSNLFLEIQRPPAPTRLFTNAEDALKWLKKD